MTGMFTSGALGSLPLAISLDGIFYLIIIFFWVMGQFASMNKKKRRRMEDMERPSESPAPRTAPPLPRVQRGRTATPAGQPERPAPQMSEEWREIIETITGQKLVLPEDTPPALPVQPPRPKAAPKPKVQKPRTPPPPPAAAVTASRFAADATPGEGLDMAHAKLKPSSGMTMKSMSLGMPPLRLNAMRMSMSERGSITRKRVMSPADFKQPGSLKRAIVSQLILGPPKAMESMRDDQAMMMK